MKTLSEWLQEQEQLCANATPGPWCIEKTGRKVAGFSTEVVVAATPGRQMVYAEPTGGTYPAGDQRFIAAARLSLPVALKIIRAIFANHVTGTSTRELFEIAEKVINEETRESGAKP